MSKTVPVWVVQPLDHQGRAYVRGDRIELSPTRALAYRRQGKVTLTRGIVIERDPEPEPEPVQPRRRYRRRDMAAEGTQE